MKELNIVLSEELVDALECLSIFFHISRSELIEQALRNTELIQHELDIIRAEPKDTVLAVSPKVIQKTRRKVK